MDNCLFGISCVNYLLCILIIFGVVLYLGLFWSIVFSIDLFDVQQEVSDNLVDIAMIIKFQ